MQHTSHRERRKKRAISWHNLLLGIGTFCLLCLFSPKNVLAQQTTIDVSSSPTCAQQNNSTSAATTQSLLIVLLDRSGSLTIEHLQGKRDTIAMKKDQKVITSARQGIAPN